MKTPLLRRLSRNVRLTLLIAVVAAASLMTASTAVKSQDGDKDLKGKSRKILLEPNKTVDAGEVVVKSDKDHDGMSDEDEAKNGTDPNDPSDADGDKDNDGLSNGDEVAGGSNVNSADSDGDGVSDGEEARLGFNPNDPGNTPPSGATLVGISVSPSAASLSINTLLGQEPVRLKVTGLLSSGSTTDLTRADGTTYESLESNVAIVDDFGTVAGVAPGQATIKIQNGGQTAEVLITVSRFTPGVLSSVNIPGYANGVDVSGDYAFVAAGSAGLQVVDVSDRSAPHVVASLDTPGNANDVRVVGGRAYVADGIAGLQIIDVSSPASPALLGTADTPGEAEDVAVSGARAYVADGPSGLQVIDVSNPSSPAVVGAVDTPGYARGVDVSGQLVALADGFTQTPSSGGGGDPGGGPILSFTASSKSKTARTAAQEAEAINALRIVDVSDPSGPQLVGGVELSGEAMDVVVRERVAYVASLFNGFAVVDFSNPADPRVVNTASEAAPKGLALFGRYVMAAEVRFNSSVPIYDVDDPAALRYRGGMDFSPRGDYRGTAIRLDGNYTYLTGSRSFDTDARSGTDGQTALIIGRYQAQGQTTDTAGVAPSLSLLSPQAGQSVGEGRTVTISASADDDVGVAAVRFIVNGTTVAADVAAPYEFTYRVPLGVTSLSVAAAAVDYGGNTSNAPPVNMSVTADLAPTVSITAPAQGAQLLEGQATTISAAASDADGSVDRVEVSVNGERLATLASAPYETYYEVPAGVSSLTIEATVFDDLGKSATTVRTVEVLPDTVPPAVSFRSPAEGTQLYEGQGVVFTADATDNARVANVNFTINGEPYADLGSPPYETYYVVPQGINEVTVVVVATDAVGHTASASRTFSVVPDPLTTVSGRVVDGPDHTPVENAYVSVSGFSTYTGPDGTFSFQNVPTVFGDLSAFAAAPDYPFGVSLNTAPVAPVRGGVTDLGDIWFHAQYVTTLPEAPTAFGSSGYLFFGFTNPHDSLYAPDEIGRISPSTNPSLVTGGVAAGAAGNSRLYVQKAGRPGVVSLISLFSSDENGNPLSDDSFATGLVGEAREIALSRGFASDAPTVAFLGDDGEGGTALSVRFPGSLGDYSAAPIALPVEPGTKLRSLKLADINYDFRPDVLAVKVVSPTDTRLVVYRGASEGGFDAPVETPVTVRDWAGSGPARDFVLGRFTDSGYADLAVLGSDRVRVYRGNVSGVFSPEAELPLPEGMTSTGISDGRRDFYGGTREIIVTASQSASPASKAVLIYEPDGSGVFGTPRTLHYNAPAYAGDVRAEATDLNHNFSFLDLVVVDGMRVVSFMDAFRMTFSD